MDSNIPEERAPIVKFARPPSPARGIQDGLKKDAIRAKQARDRGEEPKKSGTAWSHNFLNQKSWHPLSYRNQRDLWIAETKTADAAEKNAIAQREFEEEQQFFKNLQFLPGAEQKKIKAAQSVSFIYQKPPGYDAMIEREKQEAAAKQRAAAAAAAAEAAGLPAPGPEAAAAEDQKGHKFQRDMYGKRVATIDEFPELAGAPAEEGCKPSLATVKPFGKQIRAVQCHRCGKFGHSATDKECPMFGSANGASEASRLRLEDPLTLMKAREALQTHERFEMRRPMTGRSPTRGGIAATAENQQLLTGGDDGFDPDDIAPGPSGAGGGGRFGGRAGGGGLGALRGVAGEGPELEAVMAGLSKRERKALMRALRKRQKAQLKREVKEQVAAAEAYLATHGGGGGAGASRGGGAGAAQGRAYANGAGDSPSSSSSSSGSDSENGGGGAGADAASHGGKRGRKKRRKEKESPTEGAGRKGKKSKKEHREVGGGASRRGRADDGNRR